MPAMEDLTLPNLRAWFDDIDWSATATDAGKAIADGIVAGWRLRIEGINAAGDMLAWLSDQIAKIDAGQLGAQFAEVLVNAFSRAGDLIQSALDILGGGAGGTGIGKALADGLDNALSGAGNVVESVMRKLFDFNVGFWSTLLGPTIENIKAEFGNIDLMQAGIDAINSLLSGMKQAAVDLMEWVRGLAANVAGSLGGIFSGDGKAGGGGGGGGLGDPPANDNSTDAPGASGRKARRDRRSSLETGRKFAAVPAARTDVSGTIRIAVDGPGRVTEAASSNRQVALAPERGRAVGRA